MRTVGDLGLFWSRSPSRNPIQWFHAVKSVINFKEIPPIIDNRASARDVDVMITARLKRNGNPSLLLPGLFTAVS